MRKFRRSKPITNRQFADLLYELGVYASTGLSSAEVLRMVQSGQESRGLGRQLAGVQADLDRGKNLADALAGNYPNQFKPFMASMLRSAKTEETAEVLLKIGEFLESIHLDTGKVKMALLYPLIVMLVAAVVCAMLLVFVIPVFETMFASFGGALPAPTRAVIGISDFFRQHAVPFFLAAGIVIAAGWQLDRKWQRFNAVRFWIILRLPVIGRLQILAATHIFLRTLIFLLENGRSLPFALEAASQTAEKRFYRDALNALKTKVERGETLNQALAGTGIFPAPITAIAAVIQGHAHTAAPLLKRLADRYRALTQKAVKKLSTVLQPLVIVIIGLVVGGLVFAMYLPLFALGGAVGG